VPINQQAYVVSSFDEDFCAGTAEPVTARQVLRSDQLMVTLRLLSTDSVYFQSHLVQGCPYITLEFSSATPLLASKEELALAGGGSSVTGTRIVLKLGNGHTWVVYASQPIQLVLSAASDPFNTTGPARSSLLTATAPFTGRRHPQA
jgi:endoglucanase Acf2